jgi:hypothetical protein
MSINSFAQDAEIITSGSVNMLVAGWLSGHTCEDIFVVSEDYPGE